RPPAPPARVRPGPAGAAGRAPPPAAAGQSPVPPSRPVRAFVRVSLLDPPGNRNPGEGARRPPRLIVWPARARHAVGAKKRSPDRARSASKAPLLALRAGDEHERSGRFGVRG